MKTFEEQYLEMLRDLVEHGNQVQGRTKCDYVSLFGRMLTFEVSENNFPLLTTRKMSDFWADEFKAFVVKFGTNISDFEKYGHIWKSWADDNGNLGPLYGEQLRRQYPKIKEQMRDIVLGVDRSSHRRLVITMWKYDELQNMGLPPCHGTAIQFNIDEYNKKINMYCHQRSADVVLGLPHNVPYYALMLIGIVDYINFELVKNRNGDGSYTCGVMNYSLGDYHYYSNQIEGITEQLTRQPLAVPKIYAPFNYNYGEVKLINYKYHPPIKFPAAEV